jgi:hypothetical protein
MMRAEIAWIDCMEQFSFKVSIDHVKSIDQPARNYLRT